MRVVGSIPLWKKRYIGSSLHKLSSHFHERYIKLEIHVSCRNVSTQYIYLHNYIREFAGGKELRLRGEIPGHTPLC